MNLDNYLSGITPYYGVNTPSGSYVHANTQTMIPMGFVCVTYQVPERELLSQHHLKRLESLILDRLYERIIEPEMTNEESEALAFDIRIVKRAFGIAGRIA